MFGLYEDPAACVLDLDQGRVPLTEGIERRRLGEGERTPETLNSIGGCLLRNWIVP